MDAKLVGAIVTLLVAILGNVIAFYQFHVKFKTFNEFDKIFLNKSEQKQLTDFQFISEWLLLSFALYIMPLVAFTQFGELPKNWVKYVSTFGLLFLMISLVFCIRIFIYAVQKELPKEIHLKIRKSLSTNMLLSLIWMYPISYLVASSLNWFAILTLILIGLLYSLFFTLIANKTRKQPPAAEYLVEILTEEELKKSPLIHAYIIDDKKSVLYHGADLSKNTFYVCDFSSKIYLKYSKLHEINIPEKASSDTNTTTTENTISNPNATTNKD
ncbi:hypothetical protein [Bacillus pseudomycoides]|uniref:hypothetical protein n=1 Tax=Bacillus pseudomycoides TaxID=64104 RepID=UPI000BF2C63A|nr:hypothetical protein [Bacillus pseudomycoides]MED1536182.1 hypothetical protein [Bacillus pseudomycoides]PFZ87527.1 hypothetical protein COL70_22045 [Bacillus pseudomycoides]PHD16365.1 hypothetical protein COF46_14735 [Bacillus pseudomycoides]